MDLSIIVPVYQVEKYIQACIESIYNQGLEDDRFEVIIVNDGTKDRSMEVIDDIIKAHANIRVINQENQGLSIARNNGMAVAKGEYIYFVDSDDMLVQGALKPLLEITLKGKKDLVRADYVELPFDDTAIPSQHILNHLDVEEDTGEKMLREELRINGQCCVWRTLFHRSFLQGNCISFIPGLLFEDIPFTHECYIKAQKCLRVHFPIYIYRTRRSQSITATFDSNKARHYSNAIAETWKLIQTSSLSVNMEKSMKENIYAYRFYFIYFLINEVNDMGVRVKALQYLNRLVPDMHFRNTISQRISDGLSHYTPRLYFLLLITRKFLTNRF